MRNAILKKIQASLTSVARESISKNELDFIDHPFEQPQAIELSTILEAWRNREETKEAPVKKVSRYKKHPFSVKKQVIERIKDEMKSTQSSLNSHVAEENQSEVKEKKESGRKPRYPDLEEELKAYIEVNPDAERRHIIKKAKDLKQQLELEGDFAFSKGWYQRFIKRKKKTEQQQQ